MSQPTLLNKTRTLLAEDKRTTEDIALQSGLPLSWLTTMRQGRCRSPGVNRVQDLYEFLTKKKLKV